MSDTVTLTRLLGTFFHRMEDGRGEGVADAAAADPSGFGQCWCQPMNLLVCDDNKQVGPFPAESVREMVRAGSLSPQALVWHEGAPDWIPVGVFFAQAPRIGLWTIASFVFAIGAAWRVATE